jgi:Family of unknown function (DUF6492)
MIDIVTVVFQDELPVLKLQAESVDLYCQDINLGLIYVIINDDALDVDPAWWGSFSDRVRIITRTAWPVQYVENGWLTQQLLKLLGAANSTNTWTMVLDAKTILVQPIDLTRIFDKSDRLTWGYFKIFPVFEPAKNIVSKLFNIELKNVAGPGGVPFFFHNGTVRSMIKDIELRTNQVFADWFQQQGMVTEFILYSGYIEYRDTTLDVMYTCNANRYKVCNICHNETEVFNLKFIDMMHPDTLTVSVHRGAWKELSEIQRKAYRDYLIIHGISQAKDLQ